MLTIDLTLPARKILMSLLSKGVAYHEHLRARGETIVYEVRF